MRNCESCNEPLVMYVHDGYEEVAVRHFYYEGYWFCDEECCEIWLRTLANGGYDPRADPDIGNMA